MGMLPAIAFAAAVVGDAVIATFATSYDRFSDETTQLSLAQTLSHHLADRGVGAACCDRDRQPRLFCSEEGGYAENLAAFSVVDSQLMRGR